MLQNHLSQNGINRGIKGKQFEGSQCLSGAIILLYQLLNEFTIYFGFRNHFSAIPAFISQEFGYYEQKVLVFNCNK